MASGGHKSLLTVTVNFDGSRTVLHLPKNMKIGNAIVKAAEAFKVKPEGLSFLYHGTEITDDMIVEDALGMAGSVTVIHLMRISQKKNTTAMKLIVRGKKKENVYAYCKTCKSLAIARELFSCKECKETALFQRCSAEPLNHFSSEIPAPLLEGSCGGCGKEKVMASLEFECTSCPTGNGRVSSLRQIRDNIYNLHCMKCGLRRDQVFRLACSSRHTMCLNCFGNMCKQMLGAKVFRHFEGMGYSVHCPGSGADCQHTPVPDPHHFRVVDDNMDDAFYKKFIEMSSISICPAGMNIMCTKCNIEINVGDSREETVVEPEGATVSVSGLKWYQKLLRQKPEAPAPRKRKKISCRQCSLPYCIGCKQVWHEGDCIPVNEDHQKEESVFIIDAVHAKDSCWPQNEN